jgi:hypothetical protein
MKFYNYNSKRRAVRKIVENLELTAANKIKNEFIFQV